MTIVDAERMTRDLLDQIYACRCTAMDSLPSIISALHEIRDNQRQLIRLLTPSSVSASGAVVGVSADPEVGPVTIKVKH